MNNNRSHLTIVLDRSGSMHSIAEDMEQGLQAFVEEQKKQPGELTVSFYRFDDRCERVFGFQSIQEINKLKLEPRGSTALNDAIGVAIRETGNELSKMHESDRPALVTVMIVTDGGENSSKEYSSSQVKNMITEQETKYSWKFNYLGANQDSFSVAANYGIDMNKVSNYTGNNADKVWKNFSGKMSNVRACSLNGNLEGADIALDYSAEDKKELNSED